MAMSLLAPFFVIVRFNDTPVFSLRRALRISCRSLAAAFLSDRDYLVGPHSSRRATLPCEMEAD